MSAQHTGPKLAVQVHERCVAASPPQSPRTVGGGAVDPVVSLHMWDSTEMPQLLVVHQRSLKVYDVATMQ